MPRLVDAMAASKPYHHGDLRRALLDAAERVLERDGAGALSLRAVAREAGVSAAAPYHHFKDKDDLLAAVIDRSFETWLRVWELPSDGQPRERVIGLATQLAKGLLDHPDFLRLGLMLALERRPVEPRARAQFLQARTQASASLTEALGELAPGLTDAQVRLLVNYSIAGADGLFIAKELGGDSVDLLELFEMHANAIYDTALRMLAENAR